MSSLIAQGAFSGNCGKGLKICDQQCEGGPPWSISTHRLGVWLEQPWVPLCLKPRQTTPANRNVKVERLTTQASFFVLSLLPSFPPSYKS